MMTISAMAAGQENYYAQLARQDYYSQGGEKLGIWYGAGAKHLGLEGEVRPEHLTFIMQGRGANGEPLVQLQTNRQHKPGWDVTFSAPKSVSIAWALATPDLQWRIETAHGLAVGDALRYLGANALVSRRGQGGSVREQADMVAAAYAHGTSRNQEPQLHTHVLVANVVVRADGTTGTLVSKLLYDHQLAAGAVYRSSLASRLSETLGFTIKPDGEFFKIDGIPDALVERFSSRRKEIVESLKEKGIAYSPSAAEIAALDTRAVKGHVARETLFSHWRRIAQEYGFSPHQVTALTRHDHVIAGKLATDDEAAKIVTDAAEKLGERCGSFPERSLVRAAAVKAQHRSIAAEPILSRIAKERQPGGNLLTWARGDREPHLTTRASADLQQQLEKHVESLRRNDAHHLRDTWVEQFAAKHHSLSHEQLQALVQIASAPGAFQSIDGLAGSGKTTLLRAARDLWCDAGYEVIGCAPTGRAAQELKSGSGIPSRTVASQLWRSAPQAGAVLDHEARQLTRAIVGKRRYGMGTERLTSKTILVVDEASMVSAVDLRRLLGAADRANAKVVLVGDRHQFEAIEHPGAFGHLVDKYGTATLTEVQRQGETWEQHAVSQLAAGDVRGALTQFALAGRAHVCDSRAKVRQELASCWRVRKTPNVAKSLIIARTREAVAELNTLAQAARHENGELGSLMKQKIPGAWVYRGDRVMFTRTNKRGGYSNGEFGTVESIGLDKLSIVLDRTERRLGLNWNTVVTLRPGQYQDVQLGYAVTAHKAQGITVDRAFVAAELSELEPHDRNEVRTTYVQLSRAREETQVFLAAHEAGEQLRNVAELVSKQHADLQQQRQQQIDEQIRRVQQTQNLQQR